MPIQASLINFAPNAFKRKGLRNRAPLGLRCNGPRILTAGGSSDG
jgi:hypothetical protein